MSDATAVNKNEPARRGCAWAVVVAICLLVVLAGTLTYKLGSLSIRLAFADDQTEIFEEMREKAISADPYDAAQYLEYAVNYYPSRTKQDSGSRLDPMVERARRSAIREIIAHLRTTTGKDLGDDPQVWITRLTK